MQEKFSQKNIDFLTKEFSLWKHIKDTDDNTHKLNVDYHKTIKKNVDEITHYFSNLSEAKKELIRNNKSIQYLFWEAYEKKLISFSQFKELNLLENSGRDRKYLKNQKIRLMNIIDDENILDELSKEYSLIESRIDYYYEANKRFYQILLEDENISDIIDLIEEAFRNTNSNNYGNSKKIINKGNKLHDIFMFFLKIKNNEYESLESSFKTIHQLGSSLSYEVLGLYHLNEPTGFIYNNRIENFFNFVFDIPFKTKYPAFRTYYYEYRNIYSNYFHDAEPQNMLLLNVGCDSFIYWFTKERIKIHIIKKIDEEIKVIKKNKQIPKADKNLLINATIRKGQGYFKEELKNDFDCCPITLINQSELLIASHIKPWAKCISDEEKLDKNNGFLFSPTIDKLFDGGLITFSDEGKLIISKKLTGDTVNILKLDVDKIYDLKLNNRRKEFLKYHKEHIFK